LPVLSLVSVNACSVLKICIAKSGLIAVVASSLFEKYENTTGKSLCNKFVAYCFTSAPGLALSLELIDVSSSLISVVCGVAVSVLFSVMMYKVIER